MSHYFQVTEDDIERLTERQLPDLLNRLLNRRYHEKGRESYKRHRVG